MFGCFGGHLWFHRATRKEAVAIARHRVRKGSGLIAGETSRAYDDIFTITLVTTRSVSIGAYLVWLGERAVQVEGQPIILTDAPALNEVLSREVYTSNLQLGGTQIIHKNGVSHLTAGSDLEGAQHMLQWLSYVPAVKGRPLPALDTTDSWDREIGYKPPKGPYDPRWFITRKTDETTWQSGFFDKGSFQETLADGLKLWWLAAPGLEVFQSVSFPSRQELSNGSFLPILATMPNYVLRFWTT